mmetsp:Transcript_42064/g.65782  ORF Transcript_42064/g.65782 Transcript_42064/m.65782 type:complete len:150 (+) Transcript_42064:761-1210(+)
MDWTALHRAAAGGWSRTVRTLVQNGACVHGAGDDSTYTYTPLHEAVWCGQFGCTRALVEHGADPLRPDNWGTTALELAKSQLKDGNRELWDYLSAVTESRTREGEYSHARGDPQEEGSQSLSVPTDGESFLSFSPSTEGFHNPAPWSIH